jgi:hypothetical protein
MTEHFKPADKQLWFSALKDRFNLFKQSRKSQLMGVDLRYAHLEDHDLSGRQRQGAYLLDAFLNNTNLDGANLQSANRVAVKKLSCLQLVRAKNWQLAVFTAASKEASQRLFVPVNPADNQLAIQQRRLQCPELNGDPPLRHKLPHAPAPRFDCDRAPASQPSATATSFRPLQRLDQQQHFGGLVITEVRILGEGAVAAVGGDRLEGG